MMKAVQAQQKTAPPPSLTVAPNGLLQRKCACGGSAGITGECEQCDKQKLSLQRSTENPEPETRNSGGAPPIENGLRAPGPPLDMSNRAFMDSEFGHDFSQVRVHTDALAGKPAQGVGSLAYGTGWDTASGVGEYSDIQPERQFFTPEDVLSGAEEGTVEEAEEEQGGEEEPSAEKAAGDTSCNRCDLEPLFAVSDSKRPHAGAATIKCEGGKYVVKLNAWAGQPCGIPSCVETHESVHITDWVRRWPDGCKKKDGTNQPDGYLPKGGPGYSKFLKDSECMAHILDLDCAGIKKREATGSCVTNWDNYIKLTEKSKKRFC